MSTDLVVLQTLAFSLSGIVALSLAMDRHHEQFSDRGPLSSAMRVGLRAAGALMLLASLWACIVGWGATVGVVAWCGFLTAGASLVVLMLTYRPRWAATIGIAGGIVAVALNISV